MRLAVGELIRMVLLPDRFGNAFHVFVYAILWFTIIMLPFAVLGWVVAS